MQIKDKRNIHLDTAVPNTAPVIDHKDGYYCTACGKNYQKQAANFYTAQSPLYAGNNGFLPVCKECVEKIGSQYSKILGGEVPAIKRLCEKFDTYYSDTLIAALSKCPTNQSVFSYYFKMANLRQYKGKTYDLTHDENHVIENEEDLAKNNENTSSIRVTKKAVSFWGAGFSPEEYQTMEEHYKMLSEQYNNADSVQDTLLKELCRIQVMKDRAFNSGDAERYDKALRLYLTTLKGGNLQIKGDEQSGGNDPNACWGVYNSMIEKYVPSDIYKNRSLYDDEDDIGGYFKRFILRPIKNFFSGSRELDKEYSITAGAHENEEE